MNLSPILTIMKSTIFIVIVLLVASTAKEEEFLNELGLQEFVDVFKDELLTIDQMLTLRDDQLRELRLWLGATN